MSAETAGLMPEQKQELYLKTSPILYRNVIKRALHKQGGRMNAIKAKCLACANFERVEVGNCTVILFPLHPWRPYQDKAGPVGAIAA